MFLCSVEPAFLRPGHVRERRRAQPESSLAVGYRRSRRGRVPIALARWGPGAGLDAGEHGGSVSNATAAVPPVVNRVAGSVAAICAALTCAGVTVGV